MAMNNDSIFAWYFQSHLGSSHIPATTLENISPHSHEPTKLSNLQMLNLNSTWSSGHSVTTSRKTLKLEEELTIATLEHLHLKLTQIKSSLLNILTSTSQKTFQTRGNRECTTIKSDHALCRTKNCTKCCCVTQVKKR